MKVGFTGTRTGTTDEQHRALCLWVQMHEVTEFHHGCCLGADTEAFDIVVEYAPDARRIAHPPTNRSLVSEKTLRFSHETRAPLPYLERNRAIVDETEILLACPAGPEEQRSGTWSTIRYGRKLKRRILIFWPDGTVTKEGQPVKGGEV